MKFRVVSTFAVLAALAFPIASWSDEPDFDVALCENATVSKAVVFHGRKLEEIPDITEPELRSANQLLSSGCRARAEAIFEEFLSEHPGNMHAAYVLARAQWMRGSPELASETLLRVLRYEPEFASAMVLLAGLEIVSGNIDGARGLLDDAEARSPTDVWIYLNRNRLAAMQIPTPPGLMERMFEIARNEEFPPNVRTAAIEIAKPLTGASAVDFEELLRIDADIPSVDDCHVKRLLSYLNSEGRYDEVRKFLESPRRRGSCGAFGNRLFLAQAYLMQAAAISPTPVRANAELIAKADELLAGDYVGFAIWIDRQAQSPKWVPMLKGKLDPNEEYEDGFSLLCHAATMLDAELVRVYLEVGGIPESSCGGMPIMQLLAFRADGTNTTGLQDTARVLLEHGAPPPQDLCGKVRDPGYCSRDLLPLFLRFVPHR